jgi:hypothetical protein
MTLSAKSSRPIELTLTDEARRVLVRALRVAFPHQRFPDGPYERTADKVIEAADASIWSRLLLIQGLSSLDSQSGGSFLDLDEEDATQMLKHVEGTEFFGLIRRTAVVNLYDDPEVWEALGYEGSSFEKGGYVDRGFDDLDWLPPPRIEEYSGTERIRDVAPNFARSSQVQPATASITDASHPGVASHDAQAIPGTEEV